MRNKVENTKKYVADFETLTLTDEEIKQGKNTYVWAWALCDVDTLETKYGTDIKSFIDTISKLNSGSHVYFHNLKFDGNFILNYIVNNGYKEVNRLKDLVPFSYTALVSDLGTWYNITIKFKRTRIFIYDSLKKLPFSVATLAHELGYEEQKGEIDYHEYRAEGGELSTEDKDYIRRDVQIVAKALNDVCFSKGLYGITIGSDCMKMFKEQFCLDFDELFPELSKECDTFCRKAYKGGVCWYNKKFQGKLLGNGRTYDNNSEHPASQHSPNPMPYGKPEYFTGAYERIPFYPLFIQHFKASFCVKEGYMPTVQIKDNICYKDTEYVEEAYEPVELYMTNIDLEIFFEHYYVFNYEPIDGYAFRSAIGLFDKYIDYWYQYKAEATAKGDKVGRLVAKLALNNLGGRFALSPDATHQSFRVENGILRHHYITDEKHTVYCPVSAFMTAQSRKTLINAVQANYDRCCYTDTDSIHLIGDEEAKGIEIHPTKLGAWKLESTWTAAKFLRQKTYAELIDGKWEIKGCGMNDEVKANIKDINDFKINAEFSGKKTSKQVKGGIVLRETTFKILPI